ncbi:hypothetical protein [Microbulbifer litoralis]|uniref:hypothetical protein n=1 Tax=Microbulbifer litoralis TaxID=2933965 RepID=UPI0020278BE2|nr:hypothetical protein [Microbulbifer sp. GX H0434]
MRTGILPLLLSLLLLALAGQAMAAPCAPESADASPMHSHAGDGATAAGAAHKKTGDHGADCESHGQCGQGCCPGLCASALPAAEPRPACLPGSARPENYRTFNSSPAPESPLRPPISR